VYKIAEGIGSSDRLVPIKIYRGLFFIIGWYIQILRALVSPTFWCLQILYEYIE